MTFSIGVIIFVIFLLMTEGFFSGSELALLSADRIQLKKQAKQGNRGAKIALRLLEQPERILSTTLLMTATCVMAITVLLTLEFKSVYGEHGEEYAVIVGSAAVILFGELLPKFLFRKYNQTLAPMISIPIFTLQKLIGPVIRFVGFYTSQLQKVITPIDALWSGKRGTFREEIQGLLGHDGKDSAIGAPERRMIKRILKFRDIQAKDAAVPLTQVDALDKTSTVAAAIEEFERSRHSRMPVYEERVDNIVGIVEFSSLLQATNLLVPLDQHVKPAHYVAETQKLVAVLQAMNEVDSKMSIIVNEYGGALGILTREDIFEQIVGDLEDEDDREEKEYKVVNENSWVAKASMTISQVNQQLLLDLPEGDYDTLAGFLLRQFGKIPEVGDEVYFDTRAGQILFKIKASNARKIESVFVERFILSKE